VIGLTRAVAREVATRNITVNAVCPGYTDTDLVREAAAKISAVTGRKLEDAVQAMTKSNPQGDSFSREKLQMRSRGCACLAANRSPGRASWSPGRIAVSAAVGMDSRLTDDHHESLRLWLRLLTCTHLVETHVRKALAKEFKTTLPRFDLMAQLERAPQGLADGRAVAAHAGNRRQRNRNRRPFGRCGVLVRTEDRPIGAPTGSS